MKLSGGSDFTVKQLAFQHEEENFANFIQIRKTSILKNRRLSSKMLKITLNLIVLNTITLEISILRKYTAYN